MSPWTAAQPGMSAAHELLIDLFVTRAAVGGRHSRGDDETVMVLAMLSRRRLVALQAINLALGVNAQLVFVDDGILLIGMAFGALARSPDEGRRGLVRHQMRPIPVQHERCNDQGRPDHERDEDRAKKQGKLLCGGAQGNPPQVASEIAQRTRPVPARLRWSMHNLTFGRALRNVRWNPPPELIVSTDTRPPQNMFRDAAEEQTH